MAQALTTNHIIIINYICCSVIRICLAFCDPMDHSMPVSSVLHYLLDIDQIHVH